MNLELSVAQAIDAKAPVTDVVDPGPKASDHGREHAARRLALQTARAALDVESELLVVGARASAAHAETAVWLGASLADLAVVTRTSRQAVRKKWPALGAIHRRRTWLGNHVDDVQWAARVLADSAAELDVDPDPLIAGAESLAADFGTDPVLDVARWHRFDAFVDRTLRDTVDAARTPDAGENRSEAAARADFALFGARGLLGYYDHAISGRD